MSEANEIRGQLDHVEDRIDHIALMHTRTEQLLEDIEGTLFMVGGYDDPKVGMLMGMANRLKAANEVQMTAMFAFRTQIQIYRQNL